MGKSISLFAVMFVTAALPAFAADVTWTGAVDSDWSNASNWDVGVPTPADDIIISSGANVEIKNSTAAVGYTLTLDSNAFVSLDLGSSFLGGSNTYVNNGSTLSSNGFFRQATIIASGEGSQVICESSGFIIQNNNWWKYTDGADLKILGGEYRIATGYYATVSRYGDVWCDVNDGSIIDVYSGMITIQTNPSTPTQYIAEIQAKIDDGSIIGYGGAGQAQVYYDWDTSPWKPYGGGCTFIVSTPNAPPTQEVKDCPFFKLNWWENFPRFVHTSVLSVAKDHYADAAMYNAESDPGWGIYGQKVSRRLDLMAGFTAAGIKSIPYFETYGQNYCYIAEIGPPNAGEDWNDVLHNHWSWHDYDGGQIEWVGAHNWFDDEAFAQPYTRTHPVFGGSAAQYPDGNEATGYNGPSDDPRNSRVYDAICSKDIFGGLHYTANYNAIVNATDPCTGQPAGPLDGLLYIPSQDGDYSGNLLFGKDAVCPNWTDFTYASTLHATSDAGIHGMWSDNFNNTDSFGQMPVTNAFGDWSVAKFRDYLSEHFSAAELAAMGVTDVNNFDIRSFIIDKAESWGWDGSNLYSSKLRDSRWQNEPLWQAYSVFKRQTGTEALDAYDNAVYQAAEDSGIDDFVLAGNGNTVFNYGWARNSLEMVSSEFRATWWPGTGSRGFMLPPAARITPVYKVGHEHGRSRFISIWFYNTGYEQYSENPGICWVLYSEMLAAHTMPLAMYDYVTDVFGSNAINLDFFSFTKQIEAELAHRMPVEDVGIYLSTSTIHNQMLPGGVKDFDGHPHQFAVWGWGTALNQLQYQYRMLPEWKLDDPNLSDLRVLVIPESKVFDSNDAASVLQPWVNAGGLLIVTGASGERFGESGYFAIDPNGYCLEPLTGVDDIATAPASSLTSYGAGKVLYIKDNIGMDYYDEDTLAGRNSLLPQFKTYMTQLLQGQDPMVLTPDANVPSSVSLTVFEDLCDGKLIVDVVNFDIVLGTDVVTNTPPMSFSLRKPQWLQDKVLTTVVLSPDTAPSVQVSSPDDSTITVTVSPLKHYASIIISYDNDADINNDGDVNMEDYSHFAGTWGKYEFCDALNSRCDMADLTRDYVLDLDDLNELISYWLFPD